MSIHNVLILLATILIGLFVGHEAKPSADSNLKMLARWCCVNQNEYLKCTDWKNALFKSNQSTVLLDCVAGTDKFDCFKKIFEDQADLMTADAGDIYTAGKYYNLVPISSELYGSQLPGVQPYSGYYSVAVIKRGSGLTMDTLKGKNSCHGGVGTSSGWNVPISTLIEKKLLEIVDCNNHVKAATKFFNRMCAPDALNTQFNPTGDNPTSACDLCAGKIGSTFCTNQDPYAGHIGAMYCLTDGGGDVAFVKHTTVNELAAINSSINANNYELLCPNHTSVYMPYTTAPINSYLSCNWGQVPGRAVLTSSRKAKQQKNDYKAFIRLSAQIFSGQPQFATQQYATISPNFNQYPNPYNNQLQYNQQPQAQSFYNQQQSGFNQQAQPFFNQQPSFGGYQQPAYNQPAYGWSGIGYNQQQQQQQFGRKRRQSNIIYNQNQTQQQQQYLTGADRFYMFSSLMYGGRDLIFIDDTISFEDLDDDLTYLSFLNNRCKLGFEAFKSTRFV
jgi:melanoma-associated antigen p97